MTYFVDMNNQVLSSKNLIYVLHHDSSKFVYVGQTSRGELRFKEHFSEHYLASTKGQARSKWIKAMRARGHEPLISVLEECASPDDLNEAEQFHIANMRALGFKLLNHTEGGEGTRGFRFTEEQKQACSERMKKRAEDPEYIAQRSEDMKRRNADPEFRARLEKVMEKRKKDPNFSTKMSEISLGQWTEEKRKKKSESMKGKGENISPEARKKQADALRGKPKSAEHRAALSEAKRLKWQDPVYRARQIASQIEAQNRPEVRLKKSLALMGRTVNRTRYYRVRDKSSSQSVASMKQSDHQKAVRLIEEHEWLSGAITFVPNNISYDHFFANVNVPSYAPILELG